MNKRDQETFEQFAKMNEALRIAKDALNDIRYLPELIDDQASLLAVRALAEIDKVLNNKTDDKRD